MTFDTREFTVYSRIYGILLINPKDIDRAEVAERTKAPLISKTVLQDGVVVRTHSLPKFIIYYCHSENLS